MVELKSRRELALMREAGKIVAECHARIAERIRPGITTRELDREVERWIRKQGAKPSFKGHHGFPASICVALNDVICHGFPTDTPLTEGDVVSIDIGAYYRGFHGDSAWTYAVGKVPEDVRHLMEVGLQSLKLGIAAARAGNRIGDIGAAIQQEAEGKGYGVVREIVGHGVGRELWEEPQVPHFGYPGTGLRLKPGMVLAIEPMITAGTWQAQMDNDGWTARTQDGSLCVQYEHTVAITTAGAEVLTKRS